MSEITVSLHFTFAPEDLQELFEMARDAGYDGVEPMIPRGRTDSPSPPAWPAPEELREEVRRIRKVKDSFGLRTDTFYAGGLWVLRDEDQDRVKREIALFTDLLPLLAGECGARAVTVNLAGALVAKGAGYMELDRNGSAVAEDLHYARAAGALREIGEAADRVGMTVAVEMHGCSLADTAGSTRRLMEQVNGSGVGVTWDTGNLFTMGRVESWPRQLQLVGPFITNVHLKNALRGPEGWRRTPLSDGAMEDVGDQVQELKAIGYAGALVVEAPGLKIGRLDVARSDLAFLRAMMSPGD